VICGALRYGRQNATLTYIRMVVDYVIYVIYAIKIVVICGVLRYGWQNATLTYIRMVVDYVIYAFYVIYVIYAIKITGKILQKLHAKF
jgi:hypothetical protein